MDAREATFNKIGQLTNKIIAAIEEGKVSKEDAIKMMVAQINKMWALSDTEKLEQINNVAKTIRNY